MKYYNTREHVILTGETKEEIARQLWEASFDLDSQVLEEFIRGVCERAAECDGLILDPTTPDRFIDSLAQANILVKLKPSTIVDGLLIKPLSRQQAEMAARIAQLATTKIDEKYRGEGRTKKAPNVLVDSRILYLPLVMKEFWMNAMWEYEPVLPSEEADLTPAEINGLERTKHNLLSVFDDLGWISYND